jgi:hypothetical protein
MERARSAATHQPSDCRGIARPAEKGSSAASVCSGRTLNGRSERADVCQSLSDRCCGYGPRGCLSPRAEPSASRRGEPMAGSNGVAEAADAVRHSTPSWLVWPRDGGGSVRISEFRLHPAVETGVVRGNRVLQREPEAGGCHPFVGCYASGGVVPRPRRNATRLRAARECGGFLGTDARGIGAALVARLPPDRCGKRPHGPSREAGPGNRRHSRCRRRVSIGTMSGTHLAISSPGSCGP